MNLRCIQTHTFAVYPYPNRQPNCSYTSTTSESINRTLFLDVIHRTIAAVSYHSTSIKIMQLDSIDNGIKLVSEVSVA